MSVDADYLHAEMKRSGDLLARTTCERDVLLHERNALLLSLMSASLTPIEAEAAIRDRKKLAGYVAHAVAAASRSPMAEHLGLPADLGDLDSFDAADVGDCGPGGACPIR